MGRLSTTAAFLISGVLAALLIAFVFMGNPPRRNDSAAHCVSRAALDQVKTELFRRAARLRGSDASTFEGIASSSAVRGASRIYRKHENQSGRVNCAGAIAIDLPPGLAGVGGRRTLVSQLVYRLDPVNGGGVRLVSLDNANAIVVPLAAIGQAPSQGQTQPASQVQYGPEASRPLSPTQEQSTTASPTVPRRPPAARRVRPSPPPAPPAPATTKPQRRPKTPAKPTTHAAAKPAPPPPPAARAPVSGPAPAAAVQPSFDCRRAHTRSEILVCGNSSLALLDRQMSGQFFRARAIAKPGQRAMLDRSRKHFLAVREACGSEACIAAVYRARMGDIAAIMNGGF